MTGLETLILRDLIYAKLKPYFDDVVKFPENSHAACSNATKDVLAVFQQQLEAANKTKPKS